MIALRSPDEVIAGDLRSSRMQAPDLDVLWVAQVQQTSTSKQLLI